MVSGVEFYDESFAACHSTGAVIELARNWRTRSCNDQPRFGLEPFGWGLNISTAGFYQCEFCNDSVQSSQSHRNIAGGQRLGEQHAVLLACKRNECWWNKQLVGGVGLHYRCSAAANTAGACIEFAGKCGDRSIHQSIVGLELFCRCNFVSVAGIDKFKLLNYAL
jgi:hypothetical protein